MERITDIDEANRVISVLSRDVDIQFKGKMIWMVLAWIAIIVATVLAFI